MKVMKADGKYVQEKREAERQKTTSDDSLNRNVAKLKFLFACQSRI